jgi:NADH dehydrogenase
MILVAGATGMTGGVITKLLLAQGKSVRILVRKNSPAEEMAKQGMATSPSELIQAGAQPVYGELRDRASLEKAVVGVKTVIVTANSILRDNDIDNVDHKGIKTLIDAAKDAGVNHIIFTSAFSASLDSPDPFFKIKALVEDYLRQSGITYTILRPGLFMEVWIGTVVGMPLRANQPVTLVGKGGSRQPFVSLVDVAKYAVAAVDNPAAKNTAIQISGPSSYNWNDIVEAVGKVLGQPLPVNYVAPFDPVPIIPTSMAPLLSAMESLDSYTIDMSQTSKTYGVEPTSLNNFAQHMFGGVA